MYLKNVKINNYRSIKSADITFQDGLNILIGKNGVGKSNLLRYIHSNCNYNNLVTISGDKRSDLRNLDLTATFSIKENTELTVKFKRERYLSDNRKMYRADYEIYNGDKSFKTTIGPDTNKTQLSSVRKHLMVLFGQENVLIDFEVPFPINWISIPGQIEIAPEDGVIMDFSSELQFVHYCIDNIDTRLMDEFKPNNLNFERDFYSDLFAAAFNLLDDTFGLLDEIQKLTSISDIRVSPNFNVYKKDVNVLIENLFFEFKVYGEWLPWNQLSDGTRRLFFIVSECITSPNSSIVLCEEPELGIHPHQLYKLMDFIKEQAESKQIIVSTHSPIVLDILSADELDRITIVKMGEKGTYFEKMDDRAKAKASEYIKEYGDISYYWLHSDMEDE